MNKENKNGKRMFLNFGYICKVNIDNLNSSENAGNIIMLKKIQDAKGDYYAYVSGQALRYYLKETMSELGLAITKIGKDGEYDLGEIKTEGKKRYEDIIENKPDLDLFGFMEAGKGSKKMALRRWSPVKVSPLISIYPWKDSVDMLTRKKEGQEGGDLVKVEINTLNFMKGSMVISVNEIGGYVDELNYDTKSVVEEKEKIRRMELLLDALKNLDGGAKKARLLDDITPKFLIIAKQKAGTPIFLNSLNVDENGELDLDLIQESLGEYTDIIEDYVVGVRSKIFSNEQKIKDKWKNKVKSVNEAIGITKGWLNTTNKSNNDKTEVKNTTQE